MQIGDVREVVAACELEFRQRRKSVIKLAAESLTRILPQHFVHCRVERRAQILMIFLMHMKKEEDREVRDVLK